MRSRPITQSYLLLAALLAPLACDAFSDPEPPEEGVDFSGGSTPLPFCPSTSFTHVTPSTALIGPLFAWVTSTERQAMEGGEKLLPTLPYGEIAPDENLPAAAHDALRGGSTSSVPGALTGQPRIGRNFWPFAFSAPRASAAHDQLLAIWLRQDAWLASFDEGSFTVADRSGSSGLFGSALAPGRIAGVDMRGFASCLRSGSPERSIVVFREEAIERFALGAEAEAKLDEELLLLDDLLRQVRAQSELNPVGAFDGLTCDAEVSSMLCIESTYLQAIAWKAPVYLPTIAALASLIDALRAIPKTQSSGRDWISAEDLAAWTAVWPGPWRPASGSGGNGTGGNGTGGNGTGGVGGLGGSEG